MKYSIKVRFHWTGRVLFNIGRMISHISWLKCFQNFDGFYFTDYPLEMKGYFPCILHGTRMGNDMTKDCFEENERIFPVYEDEK